MPFTQHPLSYEINKLMINLGCRWEMLKHHAPVPEGQRGEVEEAMNEFLGISEAVEAGLLTRCHYIWNYDGTLLGIKPIPTNRVMRTPGLPVIREIFLKRIQ